jgi:hypothetical protein
MSKNKQGTLVSQITPVIPDPWKAEVGGLLPRAILGKSTRPHQKQTKAKRAGGLAQVVEHLDPEFKLQKHTHTQQQQPNFITDV